MFRMSTPFRRITCALCVLILAFDKGATGLSLQVRKFPSVALSSNSTWGNCKSKKYDAFIHVNKAGGTSVADALTSCDEATGQGTTFWEFTGDALLHLSVERYKHAIQDQLNVSKSKAEDIWKNDVFSFTFVRNPYDRHVSLFHYKLDNCAGGGLAHCEFFSNTTDDEAISNSIKALADSDEAKRLFGTWVRRMDNKYHIGSNMSACFGGACDNIEGRADASQMAWISDATNTIAVSAILTLENDTTHVFEEMLAQCVPACTGTQMPQSKTSSHKRYEWYYEGDPEAMGIVEKQMSRDFEYLGYDRSLRMYDHTFRSTDSNHARTLDRPK